MDVYCTTDPARGLEIRVGARPNYPGMAKAPGLTPGARVYSAGPNLPADSDTGSATGTTPTRATGPVEDERSGGICNHELDPE